MLVMPPLYVLFDYTYPPDAPLSNLAREKGGGIEDHTL